MVPLDKFLVWHQTASHLSLSLFVLRSQSMLSSHVEPTQATQQQQRLLPENFAGLVQRLGQELSCAIW